MKTSDRLAVIDLISRELQTRYTFTEIDDYFSLLNVSIPPEAPTNSKRLYARSALSKISLLKLSDILEDLEIDPISRAAVSITPPKNWGETKYFRLFISHLSSDKDKATRLRDELLPYGINAFVAHEDIQPTLRWQDEIERALYAMDAFLAIHTTDFSKSSWTQQEVGFAVARHVKIISLRMGEDPTGFISRAQALSRRDRNAGEIAEQLNQVLSNDPLTAEKLTSAKSSLMALSEDDEVPF